MAELFNTFLIKCIPARMLLSGTIIATPSKYLNYWVIPSIISIIFIFSRIVNYNILKNQNITQKGAFGHVFKYNYTRFFSYIDAYYIYHINNVKKNMYVPRRCLLSIYFLVSYLYYIIIITYNVTPNFLIYQNFQ